MGALSKRAESAQYLAQYINILNCPICHTVMTVQEESRVVCENNHSFDIAKQGYINFMTHPAISKYSKELFEARMAVIQSGLYDELQKRIAHKIKGALLILDTGCGEGSHLVRICSHFNDEVVAVGIDIAKEGILTAAKNYSGNIWCVGDLAKSPYRTSSFDVILNILSPANYDEFKRLLRPNGVVVKVVPQNGYLQELRTQLYADSEKETYANDQTVARFRDNFSTVDIERVTYTVPITHELVPALLEMTPMGWHKQRDTVVELSEITIDVDVLIGRDA